MLTKLHVCKKCFKIKLTFIWFGFIIFTRPLGNLTLINDLALQECYIMCHFFKYDHMLNIDSHVMNFEIGTVMHINTQSQTVS